MSKKHPPQPASADEFTALKQELDITKQNYQRALADYQNLEKRTQTRQGEFLRLANVTIIDKFLFILDNLERAATHISDPGLKLIINEFNTTLESEGVTHVDTSQPFNPEEMECVDRVKGDKNQIIEVVLKGYKLNDHLIRPAKVKVGAGK